MWQHRSGDCYDPNSSAMQCQSECVVCRANDSSLFCYRLRIHSCTRTIRTEWQTSKKPIQQQENKEEKLLYRQQNSERQKCCHSVFPDNNCLKCCYCAVIHSQLQLRNSVCRTVTRTRYPHIFHQQTYKTTLCNTAYIRVFIHMQQHKHACKCTYIYIYIYMLKAASPYRGARVYKHKWKESHFNIILPCERVCLCAGL